MYIQWMLIQKQCWDVIGAQKCALRTFFWPMVKFILNIRYWSWIPKNAIKKCVILLEGLLVPVIMLPIWFFSYSKLHLHFFTLSIMFGQLSITSLKWCLSDPIRNIISSTSWRRKENLGIPLQYLQPLDPVAPERKKGMVCSVSNHERKCTATEESIHCHLACVFLCQSWVVKLWLILEHVKGLTHQPGLEKKQVGRTVRVEIMAQFANQLTHM